MLYKSKKYVLICGTLLCTSNLLLGSSKGDPFGSPSRPIGSPLRGSRMRVFGTSRTPKTPQIPRLAAGAFENRPMFGSDYESDDEAIITPTRLETDAKEGGSYELPSAYDFDFDLDESDFGLQDELQPVDGEDFGSPRGFAETPRAYRVCGFESSRSPVGSPCGFGSPSRRASFADMAPEPTSPWASVGLSKSPTRSSRRGRATPGTPGRLSQTAEDRKTSDDFDRICENTLAVRKTWIEKLDVFGDVYKCVAKIDGAFPHLGFRLAFESGWLPKANPIFGADLPGFIPDADSAGSVQGLKKGDTAFGTYILKPKVGMGRQCCDNQSCIKRESRAGERIRKAFVQKFINIKDNTKSKNFDETLQKVGEELPFLKFLVAPVDCGDYIASREVPEATSVWGALKSSSSSIDLPGGRLPELEFPQGKREAIPGMEILDLSDMDQETEKSTLNFGNSEQRVTMARNLWEIMEFLHRHGIIHGDLQAKNFLVRGGDYTQIYLIDFDQANNPRRPNDENKMREFLIEYLFCTTKVCRFTEWEKGIPFENVRTAINGLNGLNPSFQYTPAELAEIEEILTQSFQYMPKE